MFEKKLTVDRFEEHLNASATASELYRTELRRLSQHVDRQEARYFELLKHLGLEMGATAPIPPKLIFRKMPKGRRR
jgi:hypothetical protein